MTRRVKIVPRSFKRMSDYPEQAFGGAARVLKLRSFTKIRTRTRNACNEYENAGFFNAVKPSGTKYRNFKMRVLGSSADL